MRISYRKLVFAALTGTALIKPARAVANVIGLLGTLTIIAAGIGAVYYSIYPQDETDL